MVVIRLRVRIRQKRDPPAQLEPDREEIDLLSEPLALDKAAKEKVGKDRQHRAEEEFQHGSRLHRCGWLIGGRRCGFLSGFGGR